MPGHLKPSNGFDKRPMAGPGRPKGSPNKSTEEIRECLRYIVGKQLDKLEAAFDSVYAKDPAKFLSLYERFCTFTLPKMQEITLSNTNEIDINATINTMREKLSEMGSKGAKTDAQTDD